MQHPFGALTRNFRLIKLRKCRGRQPTRPAGEGETQVVSAKCLMSLSGNLLRPAGIGSLCLSFIRYTVVLCLLKETSTWPLLSVHKLSDHHIVHNIVDTRLKNSLFPFEAQWPSGRVFDSRPRGSEFEPYRRHCVVSLRKDINPSLVLIQTRKTRPFITERLLMR